MTRPLLHCLLVGFMLGAAATLNGISRSHPDSWRLFNGLDSVVGAVCLAGMAWNGRRK